MKEKIVKIRMNLIVLAGLVAFIGFSSCEKYQWAPPVINVEDSVKFQTQIQPIFNASCALASCHNGIIPPDLRDGKSYSYLTTKGYVNQPGETAKLYTKLSSSSHQPRATDSERQLILIWINQGAHNN